MYCIIVYNKLLCAILKMQTFCNRSDDSGRNTRRNKENGDAHTIRILCVFIFFESYEKKNSTRYYRGFSSRTIKTNVITLAMRSTREQYEFSCVPIYYIMYTYIIFVREECVRCVSHLTTV